MIKMIDLNERVEFVSQFDKDEIKTVFVLKNLNSIEHLNATLKYGADQPIEAMASLIQSCLIEIRSGEQIIKDITLDVIKAIPKEVLMELQNSIMLRNMLSEQDAKN